MSAVDGEAAASDIKDSAGPRQAVARSSCSEQSHVGPNRKDVDGTTQ